MGSLHFRESIREIFVRDTKPGHLDILDGVRALSILLVIALHSTLLAYHAYGDWGLATHSLAHAPSYIQWTVYGDIGVDIFFTLSGFLISLQLLTELQETGEMNIRWFYVKRLLRIYPLYCFIILAWIVLQGPGYQKAYLNFFALSNYYFSPVAYWDWSIAIEIHFYLLAPWLLLAAHKTTHPLKLLIFICTCLLIIQAIPFITSPVLKNRTLGDLFLTADFQLYKRYLIDIYRPTHLRIACFFPGVIAAYIWVMHSKEITKIFNQRGLSNFLMIGATLLLLYILSYDRLKVSSDLSSEFSTFLHGFLEIYNRFMICCIIAVFILLSLTKSPWTKLLRHFLSSKLWHPISRTSYSMYMFNLLIFAACYAFLFYISDGYYRVQAGVNNFHIEYPFLIFITLTLMSLILGVVTYVLIERWFLKGALRHRIKRLTLNK